MPESLSFPIREPLPAKVVGRYREELLPLLAPYPVRILAPEDPAPPALVISYGGDGTLLGAERDFPGIPKLPLRDRSHNPRCPLHGEARCLEHFFHGDFAPAHFSKLRARGAHGEELVALNDLVIARHLHPLGAIRVRLWQDGAVLFPQVIADAVVIATTYGATGYFQSITRGTFQRGIGVAFSNAVEGECFRVIAPESRLEVELLRGPAIVQAGNNPEGLALPEGERLLVLPDPRQATIYGLEAFRCRKCHRLRQDGQGEQPPL